MPCTADPYETEDALDHAGATADVAEGGSRESNSHEGNEL